MPTPESSIRTSTEDGVTLAGSRVGAEGPSLVFCHGFLGWHRKPKVVAFVEHMADQFPENMGLSVIPIEVKNGFGVGTIFRISGDFDGKKLEWDCETIDYVPMRKIVAKMIEGPFKSWQITVEFEELGEKKSRTGMTVEYEMPMGPLGSFMDKVKLRKIAERGMENGLYRVKALLEGTGSIPVYITLDAYRHILKEKEKLNCSVSEAIIKIVQQSQQTVKA